MKTSRLWLIAGSLALIAMIIAIVCAIAVPNAPQPATTATPTPSSSASRPVVSPSPSTSASPSPTPTPPAVIDATCENTVTNTFLDTMEAQGWRAANTVGEQIGPKPFDWFLDGVPAGAVVCRWAADPFAPTDNVVDLAWGLIPTEVAADAITRLVAQGYVMTETASGEQLVGQNGAYLFTPTDARWAQTADQLASIKAPEDPS